MGKGVRGLGGPAEKSPVNASYLLYLAYTGCLNLINETDIIQVWNHSGGRHFLTNAATFSGLKSCNVFFPRVTLAALTTWPTSTTSTMRWSSTLCCG